MVGRRQPDGKGHVRRLLLDRAVRFLDGLATDAGTDDALKVELAEGYRRLGVVQGSPGTENVGDLAAATVSFEKAVALGCQAFQIFSSSPRMWRASRLDPAEVRQFRNACERYTLHPLVIHTNYLVNLAAADRLVQERSVAAFQAEMERALALGALYLVLHPGSHRGQTLERALRTFARSITRSARGLRLGGLQILLENTAGGGFTLGRTPEELLELRRLVDFPIAFCLDTAHCFQAGLSFPVLLDMLVDVPVIHSNDSRTPYGSRVDPPRAHRQG